MREVLLIIWTLTMDLESGMFNGGGGLTVGAMVDRRMLMRCVRSAEETAEDQDCIYEEEIRYEVKEAYN